MQTQTETADKDDSQNTECQSSFFTPKASRRKTPDGHVVQVEQEFKKSLLSHLRGELHQRELLKILMRELATKEQYINIQELATNDPDMKLIRINECVKSLQTGGIIGNALVCLLPLYGRFKAVSLSARLLAPLTIMATAEAKCKATSDHFVSPTCKYVMRLWRGTLQDGMDCCVTSSPKSLFNLLDLIGAVDFEAQKRKTKVVDWNYENIPNLFTGEDHWRVTGIRPRVRP